MTRFKDNNINYKYDYLNDYQKKELYDLLYISLNKYDYLIENNIKENLNYKVITPDKNIVIVIKKSNIASFTLYIGYPFPLYGKKIEEKYNNFEIGIYIRGNVLRDKLYCNCLEKIKRNYKNFEYKEIANCQEFKEIVKKYINDREKNNLLYIDNNSFIGDTIMELRWIDIIKNCYNIEKCNIISSNYRHIDFYYNSISDKDNELVKKYIKNAGIIFIGDLLDSNIEKTQKIFEIYKPNLPIFLLGKECVIVAKNNEILKIYKLKKENTLLLNQGFQKYLDECIEYYIEDYRNYNNIKKINNFVINKNKEYNIFVNIFSSQKNKDIFFIENLIKCVKKNNNIKLLFSAGLKTIKYHSDVIEKVKKIAKILKYDNNIEIIYDKSLSDLNNILNKRNIIAGITADTSISHMLTRNGILNFTCYYYGFWDSTSEQSISCESMLSVCSSDINQVPVLLKCRDKYFDQAMSILEYIEEYIDLTNKNKFISNENKYITYFDSIFEENLIKYDKIINKIKINKRKELENLFNYKDLYEEINIIKNNFYLSKRIFEISPIIKYMNMIGE